MSTKKKPPPKDLGIESAWRYIDRFCRALWVKHLKGDPPSSLAEMSASCLTIMAWSPELLPSQPPKPTRRPAASTGKMAAEEAVRTIR